MSKQPQIDLGPTNTLLSQLLVEMKGLDRIYKDGETRASRIVAEFLDKTTALTRINSYRVYRFNTQALATVTKLKDVFHDFGEVAGNMLFCLNPGGGTAHLYLNGATSDPILVSDLATSYVDGTVGSTGLVKSGPQFILGFDIREIFYDVTVVAAGQDPVYCCLFVGAWVK